MSKGYEHTCLQRIYTNGQEAYKICSTTLVFREIQTKITMRYNFTPTRMAKIKKIITSDNQDKKKSKPKNSAETVKWYNHFGNQFSSSSKC